RTASRLKVSSNFRRSWTDVCFMGLFFHYSPDSLSVNSRDPQDASQRGGRVDAEQGGEEGL
ncbi:MAG: hypothetical protein ABSF38_18775, partial [Verrucomicrobiota bacterium]